MVPAGPLRFDGWALPPTVPFLNWAWDDILFLILAGILLGAAIFVVIGRDIVRSGLSMILAFAALAGIYVLAGAVIVAAAQVLIYIGAISVLILFAIMLTQTKSGPLQLVFHHQAWAGLLAAIGVAALTIVSVINTQWPLAVDELLRADTRSVALLLFTDPLYVFALQTIAVLLTAAVVGAVFLAKREETPDPGDVPVTPLSVRPTTLAPGAASAASMASGPAESTASQQ
jgi:NADH:ubiquinone oxidoreductase subunit 6 (subunit J)